MTTIDKGRGLRIRRMGVLTLVLVSFLVVPSCVPILSSDTELKLKKGDPIS
jgi:hypothetical protein